MAERDLFVRKIYTYKGIAVCVEVDFARRFISLAERRDDDSFAPKDWRFAERELQYMDGWMLILDAMKFAIGEAKKLLAESEESRKASEMNKLMLLLSNPPEPVKAKK